MLSCLIRCFRSALSNICFGTHWCILHGDVLAAQSTLHDDAYSLLWIGLQDDVHLSLSACFLWVFGDMLFLFVYVHYAILYLLSICVPLGCAIMVSAMILRHFSAITSECGFSSDSLAVQSAFCCGLARSVGCAARLRSHAFNNFLIWVGGVLLFFSSCVYTYSARVA